MTKMLSASGWLCPLTPWPGALPLDPLGLCPQTPVIGSCSALAMVPPNHWPLPPPMAVRQPCELLYTCYLLTYLHKRALLTASYSVDLMHTAMKERVAEIDWLLYSERSTQYQTAAATKITTISQCCTATACRKTKNMLLWIREL